jgi:hypothetical protein
MEYSTRMILKDAKTREPGIPVQFIWILQQSEGLWIHKNIPMVFSYLKCHSTSKPAFQYPFVNSCINWAHLQQATTMRRSRDEPWQEISWINQIFESLVLWWKMPNFAKEADLGQVWLHCSTIKINCNHARNEQKSVGYHLVPPRPQIS